MAFVEHMERQYGVIVVIYMAYPTDGGAQCAMLVPPTCFPLHLIQLSFRFENNPEAKYSFQNRNETRHKKTLTAFGRWAEERLGEINTFTTWT